MAAIVLAPEVASLIVCGVTVAASAVAGYAASRARTRKDHKRMEESMHDLVQTQAKELSDLKDRLEDPDLFVENEEKLFDGFVKKLEDLDLQTCDEEEDHIYCVGFQGQVSVGKSTIVNALYGDKVAKAGKGRTTATPTRVEKALRMTPDSTREIHVYDLPGHDDGFNYMSMEALRLVNSLDLVVAVYDNTIVYTDRLVRLALALGKQVVFVRNKLDIGDDDDDDDDDDDENAELGWKEELERDRQDLAKMFPGQNLKVFGISGRNAFKAIKFALASYRKQNTTTEPKQDDEESTVTTMPYELYEWNEFVRELTRLSESPRVPREVKVTAETDAQTESTEKDNAILPEEKPIKFYDITARGFFAQGKISRGRDVHSPYRFGDFTRGVLSSAGQSTREIIARGKKADGRDVDSPFKLGDFARGAFKSAEESTRGVIARGKTASGRDVDSPYQLGDFARGLFSLGRDGGDRLDCKSK